MRIKALLIDAAKHQICPKWQNAADCEEAEFDIVLAKDDKDLRAVLRKEDPDVIITFGDWRAHSMLCAHSYDVRRRWVSLDRNSSPGQIAEAILWCFMGWLSAPKQPLVSVFTAAYQDPAGIARAYASLVQQTWTSWEWVIVDDSDDDGETFGVIVASIGRDPRVRIWHSNRRSGRIGHVKRMACGLCRGKYLAELDHDDELTEGCLQEVVQQFEKHPEAGMVFTDCAEWDERAGKCHRYPEGWGMGQGSYREEKYRGIEYLVAQGPELNERTIHHIVGCPNHIRVWRREVYWAVGGHNPRLPVCDDYDLIIRTWLKHEIIHSPFFGYIQYRNGRTGTVTRNREIQRLTRWIESHYKEEIERHTRK